MISLFASVSLAQKPTIVTATDTLPAVVAAYADGDMVRGATANKIILAMEVPNPNPSGTTEGYIMDVTLRMDSANVTGGTFDIYALKDTVGIGKDLALNNVAFEYNDAIDNNFIGMQQVVLATQGTTSGGATRSYAFSTVMKRYELAAGKKKIYFLIVARGAYTPKQSGVIRLTVAFDANK